MTFNYLQRVVVDGELTIDNIGQCCVLGRNDFGEEHYLVVRTEQGFTDVIQYGPVVPDFDLLPYNVSMTYQRFEFNQGKIERIIDRFLNDPKRGISQAEESSYETILPLVNNSLIKVFPQIDMED